MFRTFGDEPKNLISQNANFVRTEETRMLELQKASVWKRASAALFDFILLATLSVGVALLLSLVLGYNNYSREFEAVTESYESAYGVDFDISAEEYKALTPEEQANFETAFAAFAADGEANRLYAMTVQLTLLILIFSVLGAFLILELLVPLLFGNGQTLGKKIFGVGVMRVDGVKISGLLLFARAILGKYTVETMLPLLIGVMIAFNIVGLGGTLLILVLLAVEIAMFAFSRERALLHDKLAQTAVIDMATQRIFDTPEALLAYKQQLHVESVDKATY